MKRSPSPQDIPDKALEQYWQALKADPQPDTFHKTAAWIKMKHAVRAQQPSFLATIKNQIVMNSLRLTFTIGAMILLVGACNYPVSDKETLASVIQWQIPENNQAALGQVDQLSWKNTYPLQVSKLEINGTTVYQYRAVLSGAEQQEVDHIVQSVKQIKGAEGVAVVPLTHEHKQPLYAAALEKFFNIQVNADNLSDEELLQSIQEQLTANGLGEVKLQIGRTEKGHRFVRTLLPEHPTSDMDFGITVKEGNQVHMTREKIKINGGGGAPDFKNMTDEQIKAHIIQKHPEQQIKPEHITISREDGKVKVEVNSPGTKQEMILKVR